MSLCSQSSNKIQYRFQSFVFGEKDQGWGITSESAWLIMQVDSRGSEIQASIKNLPSIPCFSSCFTFTRLRHGQHDKAEGLYSLTFLPSSSIIVLISVPEKNVTGHGISTKRLFPPHVSWVLMVVKHIQAQKLTAPLRHTAALEAAWAPSVPWHTVLLHLESKEFSLVMLQLPALGQAPGMLMPVPDQVAFLKIHFVNSSSSFTRGFGRQFLSLSYPSKRFIINYGQKQQAHSVCVSGCVCV